MFLFFFIISLNSIFKRFLSSIAHVILIAIITIVLVIIIVIFKVLKRHSKAKRRAPSYSRVLRQIRRVVQRIVLGRLRSDCQRGKGGGLGVKAGVV